MLKKSASIVFASDLAAALPVERRVSSASEIRSLFEHPEVILALASIGTFQPYRWRQPSFSQSASTSR